MNNSLNLEEVKLNIGKGGYQKVTKTVTVPNDWRDAIRIALYTGIRRLYFRQQVKSYFFCFD